MDKELRKAMDDLYDAYEDAVQNEDVRDPIAWALYKTWQKWEGRKDK